MILLVRRQAANRASKTPRILLNLSGALTSIIFFSILVLYSSPTAAMNLYGALQASEGFTTENEAEWNEGLKLLSEGDFAGALEHWRSSAAETDQSKGYYLAQLGLSVLLQEGLGVPRDEAEASSWSARAREPRSTSFFQESLGQAYSGSIYAILGHVFEQGIGVPSDLRRAQSSYVTAVAYGNAEGAFRLGRMFEHGGEGVAPDTAAAFSFYSQAAKKGLAKAQYALAAMYSEGRGTPQSFVRAYVWYSLALANQHSDDAFDVKHRDQMAKAIPPDQLLAAQEIASRCLATDYQECD